MAQNIGMRQLAMLVGVLVISGLAAFGAFHVYLAATGSSDMQSSSSVAQDEEARTQDESSSADGIPTVVVEGNANTETETDIEVDTEAETEVETETETETEIETAPSIEVQESAQDSTIISSDVLDVEAQTLQQAQDQLVGLSQYIRRVLMDDCRKGFQDLVSAADNLFTRETAYQDLGLVVIGDLSAQAWLEDETISDDDQLYLANILIGYAVNEISRAEHACDDVTEQKSRQTEQSATPVSQSGSGDQSGDATSDRIDEDHEDLSIDDTVIDEGIVAQIADIEQGRSLLETEVTLLIHSGCFNGSEEAILVMSKVVPFVSDKSIGTFEVLGPVGEIRGWIVKAESAVLAATLVEAAMAEDDLETAQGFVDTAEVLLRSAREMVDDVSSLVSCASVTQP